MTMDDLFGTGGGQALGSGSSDGASISGCGMPMCIDDDSGDESKANAKPIPQGADAAYEAEVEREEALNRIQRLALLGKSDDACKPTPKKAKKGSQTPTRTHSSHLTAQLTQGLTSGAAPSGSVSSPNASAGTMVASDPTPFIKRAQRSVAGALDTVWLCNSAH